MYRRTGDDETFSSALVCSKSGSADPVQYFNGSVPLLSLSPIGVPIIFCVFDSVIFHLLIRFLVNAL